MNQADILAVDRNTALHLHFALTQGWGPASAAVHRILWYFSELSAATGCWLIRRECISNTRGAAAWVSFQVQGAQFDARVYRASEVDRHYPVLSVRFTAPDGQRGTLTDTINHWARYVANDAASLLRCSVQHPIEHTCDFWQAFGNYNR
jgi:hypothetical protein